MLAMLRANRSPELPLASPEPLAVATSTARPSATPVPWREGVVAMSARSEGGARILLADLRAPMDAPRQLSSELFDEVGGLDWSPDGAWLAFAARRDGNWDLYRIAREGGAAQRLTEHPGYDAAPAYAPAGRALAFESYRDGDWEIYRLELGPAGAAAPPQRLTRRDGADLEPTWLTADQVLWSSWEDRRFALAGQPALQADRKAADGLASALGAFAIPFIEVEGDLHGPRVSPAGDHLAVIERATTRQTLRLLELGRSASPVARNLPISADVRAFAWSPGGDALVIASEERRALAIEAAGRDGRDRLRLATLPDEASTDLAWTAGPMPAGLPEWTRPTELVPASSDPELRAGLARLPGVDAPGARLNAALVQDYEAMRAELREDLGIDFLGQLSDMWRPLGFTGSSFFSWHKTGRAFDIAMDFRSPSGGTGMVILRETGGRTRWRIFLRAAAQDGSVGAPLRQPGWDFYARHGGDPQAEREGGERRGAIPAGYYVDFTAVAARYGWHRIPAISRPGFDWREDWDAIEFWHFERRDRLSWFEAARQAYDDEMLASELNAERLRELGQTGRGYGRAGVPFDLGSKGDSDPGS